MTHLLQGKQIMPSCSKGNALTFFENAKANFLFAKAKRTLDNHRLLTKLIQKHSKTLKTRKSWTCEFVNFNSRCVNGLLHGYFSQILRFWQEIARFSSIRRLDFANICRISVLLICQNLPLERSIELMKKPFRGEFTLLPLVWLKNNSYISVRKVC